MLWTVGMIILVNQRLNVENNEAREQLELIFNTSPDAVALSTFHDGRIVRINDGFCDLSGYPRQEVLGRFSLDLHIWSDPAQREQLTAALREKGSVRNLEMHFQNKSGDRLICLLSAKIIQLQGEAHILTVTRDITESKQTEKDLLESEEKHRILFRDSPDAYLMIVDGVFVDCNRAAERMVGGGREQIIGRTPAQLSPEFQLGGVPSADAAAAQIEAARVKGSHTFEWLHRKVDGSEFFVEVSIASMQVAGKQTYFTTWRDVTERKRATEALQESQQRYRKLAENNTDIIWKLGQEMTERERAQTALAESERQYRLLAENTTDVIWVLNPNTMRLVYISPSIELLLGYTPLEAMALSFRDLLGDETRDDFLARIRAQAQSYLNQPEPGASARSQVLYRRKDGLTVWVETVNHFYLNETSRQVEIQSSSRDITERKRLEAELEQQAITDELTQVYNRRFFIRIAKSEEKRSVRLKHPLAVALIDLDFFKQINDTYGHAVGDKALIAFSEICQKNVREIDVFARFGGDEFAMLLPETNCAQARQALERVRKSMLKNPFQFDGITVPVTFTAGIACTHCGNRSFDELLVCADQILYREKNAGRDRVGIELDTP